MQSAQSFQSRLFRHRLGAGTFFVSRASQTSSHLGRQSPSRAVSATASAVFMFTSGSGFGPGFRFSRR